MNDEDDDRLSDSRTPSGDTPISGSLLAGTYSNPTIDAKAVTKSFLVRESVLTAEQEIRLRCAEAACLAVSGAQFPTPAGTIINIMQDLIRNVNAGAN